MTKGICLPALNIVVALEADGRGVVTSDRDDDPGDILSGRCRRRWLGSTPPGGTRCTASSWVTP